MKETNETERELSRVLKAVSRSFYLSMVWLPPAMRRGVALGYLLARAADSVADTSSAPAAERVAVLEKMRAAIARGGECPAAAALAEAQPKASERELLQRFDTCLSLLDGLPESERAAVREVLDVIIGGQLWDLQYFAGHCAVESDEDTLRYTYAVAGCVGKFWTDLGCITLGDGFCAPDRRELMTEAAVRYGRGLQLVNILRDREEDVRLGRRYLCSDPELWMRRAERWLCDGLDYARRLGSFRLRFSSVLPALLGVKTLRLIRTSRPGQRAKIPRRAVYATLLRALFLSVIRRGA